jgi:hypothetical protein
VVKLLREAVVDAGAQPRLATHPPVASPQYLRVAPVRERRASGDHSTRSGTPTTLADAIAQAPLTETEAAKFSLSCDALAFLRRGCTSPLRPDDVLVWGRHQVVKRCCSKRSGTAYRDATRILVSDLALHAGADADCWPGLWAPRPNSSDNPEPGRQPAERGSAAPPAMPDAAPSGPPRPQPFPKWVWWAPPESSC